MPFIKSCNGPNATIFLGSTLLRGDQSSAIELQCFNPRISFVLDHVVSDDQQETSIREIEGFSVLKQLSGRVPSGDRRAFYFGNADSSVYKKNQAIRPIAFEHRRSDNRLNLGVLLQCPEHCRFKVAVFGCGFAEANHVVANEYNTGIFKGALDGGEVVGVWCPGAALEVDKGSLCDPRSVREIGSGHIEHGAGALGLPWGYHADVAKSMLTLQR